MSPLETLLGFSIAANAFMTFLLYKKKTRKTESYEVKQLLHDLTAGAGLVRVERVDPADVFIRNTRTK